MITAAELERKKTCWRPKNVHMNNNNKTGYALSSLTPPLTPPYKKAHARHHYIPIPKHKKSIFFQTMLCGAVAYNAAPMIWPLCNQFR